MKPFWKTIKSVFDEKEYKSAANEFSKTAYLHYDEIAVILKIFRER